MQWQNLLSLNIRHQKSATSEHAGTSANRRRQIADIDFVKTVVNSVQRHLSQIQIWPPTSPTATAVWVVVRGRRCRWSGGVRDFKGHCSNQFSDATVVTQNWSTCYFRVVDSMAALCRRLAVYSGSFGWQMTVVFV